MQTFDVKVTVQPKLGPQLYYRFPVIKASSARVAMNRAMSNCEYRKLGQICGVYAVRTRDDDPN